MSLIHDALKSIEQTGSPPEGVRQRPMVAVAPDRGMPSWLGGVAAFALVVVAGGGAWWLWQTSQAGAMATPQATAPTVTVPDTVVAAPVPALAPLAVPVEVAGAMALVPEVAVASPTASLGASSVAPEKYKQKVPLALAGKAKTAIAKPVEADLGSVPVELRFSRFMVAMKAGDLAGAEQELAALKERLPVGALGLMRAQAWFDLQSGRDADAANGYRAMLERLPGDEESALNLASIYSRTQRGEEARAVLGDAMRVRPDSKVLQSALAQFTPNALQ